MSKRVKILPECRKDKIRRWDDTYETVRSDIAAGIIQVGGSGKAPKNTHTKEEVDALLADVRKTISALQKKIGDLEERLQSSTK